MGYWIRGRIPDEQKNPITRALIAVYRPCLEWVLHRPKSTLVIAVLALTTTIRPLSRLGGEFLPRLDEGEHEHTGALWLVLDGALHEQAGAGCAVVHNAPAGLGEEGGCGQR